MSDPTKIRNPIPRIPSGSDNEASRSGHFEKIGKKVSWQKLGEGFDKHEFQFQILDEGLDDSWKDELNKLLQS